MVLKRTHKTILATLLFSLYAFIATPFSYWHYHKSDVSKYETEQYAKNIKATNASADSNCKICSHHYSVISNDAITVYFTPVFFFNRHIDFSVLDKITNPGYSHSNKGPPSLV